MRYMKKKKNTIKVSLSIHAPNEISCLKLIELYTLWAVTA